MIRRIMRRRIAGDILGAAHFGQLDAAATNEMLRGETDKIPGVGPDDRDEAAARRCLIDFSQLQSHQAAASRWLWSLLCQRVGF